MGKSQSSTKPIKPEQLASYYNTIVGLIGPEPTRQLSPYQSAGTASQATAGQSSYFDPGAAQQAAAPTGATAEGYTAGGAADTQGYTAQDAQIAGYDAATQAAFADPGEALRLFGGDYEKLQSALFDPVARDLAEKQDLAVKATNEDAARRGIFSSGAGAQLERNTLDDFERARADALSKAIGTRYDLQSQEYGRLNDYALSRAEQANKANQFNAGEVNRLNELVFGRGTDVNLANASEANRAAAFTAEEANKAALDYANRADTAASFGAAERNKIAAENAREANIQTRFNTEQYNSREAERAAGRTQNSQFNAGQRTATNQFNTGQRNQFAESERNARNAYNVDAFNFNPATSFNRWLAKAQAAYGGPGASTSQSSQAGIIPSFF